MSSTLRREVEPVGTMLTAENFTPILDKLVANWEVTDGHKSMLERHANGLLQSITNLQATLTSTPTSKLQEQLRKMSISPKVEALRTALAELDAIKPAIISPRELIQGLTREFDEVWIHLDGKNSIVTVVTAPIILMMPAHKREVNFNQFMIEITIPPAGVKMSYKVKALNPVYPRREIVENRKQHSHPHISGPSLCTGEGQGALDIALRTGDLFGVCMIIKAILTNYNGRSPFYRLDEWFSSKCGVCGGAVEADEAVKCSKCDKDLCKSCAKIYTCEVCRVIVCPQHGTEGVKKCKSCNRILCKEHTEHTDHLSCMGNVLITEIKGQLEQMQRLHACRLRLNPSASKAPALVELEQKLAALEAKAKETAPVAKPKRGRPKKKRPVETVAVSTGAVPEDPSAPRTEEIALAAAATVTTPMGEVVVATQSSPGDCTCDFHAPARSRAPTGFLDE